MRRRLIVGNWKMHKTAAQAAAYVQRLSKLVRKSPGVEIVLAPPFTALHITSMPAARAFAFAAQNLYWEEQGAFTGEISAPMLRTLGCRYVIIGHSERRKLFNEDDGMINKKVGAALCHGLFPILCVGESLSDRKTGRARRVVTRQLRRCLKGISARESRHVTIAYEPVWAIGTGHAAVPAHIIDMHRTVRSSLARIWDAKDADRVRILYGGSVTPENVSEFLASPEVDGALVGGACLDPTSFAKIISRAQSQSETVA